MARVYEPLKAAVEQAGGIRLAMHGGLRDQVVDMAVLHWPRRCEDERLEEVLAARVAIAIRAMRPGWQGVLVTALVGVPVCRMVVDWTRAKRSNERMMQEWNLDAQADTDVAT